MSASDNNKEAPLRQHYRLMEADELTPEERLERIVELLALASVTAEDSVLKTEIDGQI